MQEDPRRVVAKWWAKIKILKDQIGELEKLKKPPIIAISVFLLKSQIIEFELKQLIFSLDSHLYFYNSSTFLQRRIRTPKDLDNLNLTLRKLVIVMNEFIEKSDPPIKIKTHQSISHSGSILKKLKINLNKLVDKRDAFTHHIFDINNDFQKLNKDAVEGIELANKTLQLMDDLEKDMRL